MRKGTHLLNALLLLGIVLLCSCARTRQFYGVVNDYVNPLDVSIADPQILRDGDTYYLYGTTTSHIGFEVFSSEDLVHWRRKGFCYKKTEDSWGQHDFWAPETIEFREKYYLFYTSRHPTYGRNISVAVATSPLGPFEDAASPLLDTEHTYIDGHTYLDPVSKRHYFYVLEESARPPMIRVARLSKDLLSLDTPLEEVFVPTQWWEYGWVEGAFIVKHGPWYYMTYSGEGYADANYAVGYATALNPMGPWTKYDHNPILKKNYHVSGPGHNSLVLSPDGRDLYVAYHRHLNFQGGWQRQLAIDKLEFVDAEQGPDVLRLADGSASYSERPFPSGGESYRLGRSDSFDGDDLDWRRWSTFGEVPENWRLENGSLVIETANGDFHERRVDGSNAFFQYAPEGDFRAETKVHFVPEKNFEQALLVVWQDQSNYIKFGPVFSVTSRLEYSLEMNGIFGAQLAENDVGADIYLRIDKTGSLYQLSYRGENTKWKVLPETFEADFKQIKVGLAAFSPGSGEKREARFDYLNIEAPEMHLWPKNWWRPGIPGFLRNLKLEDLLL